MANVFNSVKGMHPKFNSFSAHTYRNDFTSQLGVNIPVYVQHVVPNTRVKLSTSALIRLQALIAPIMDNIDFYVHFWKIPYRLLEKDRFTQFISGEIEQEEYEGAFFTPYALAQAILAKCIEVEDTPSDVLSLYNKVIGNGSLLDMLGYDLGLFPVVSYDSEYNQYNYVGGNNITSFNFRGLIAYFMLHENWYMNENVPYFNGWQENYDSIFNDPANSIQAFAYLLVNIASQFTSPFLPHGWEKDYFTSALPNVQNGDPVSLPIAGTAPVNIPPQTVILNPAETPTLLDYIQFGFNGTVEPDDPLYTGSSMVSGKGQIVADTDTLPINQILGKLEGNTESKQLVASADLSEVTAITINELRFANALQVFKERQLRFGHRRQEYYKGFFDVTPEDFRLQLPKYLGGGRIPINIADIEQTSKTDGSQALGHLAGKATAVAGGFAGFSTFCSEESIIIGIAFAMPHITYCQHISKFLLKTNDIYDYFNPSFEHLGEQAIQNIEVYSKSVSPAGEFGYTPRFNEYRFHMNEMHGEFKNTLAYWTLGRIFSSQPQLNAKFVYMQPNVFDRIFAVSGQPSMLASMLFRVRIVQPVSKYGTPMLLA